MNNSPSTKTVMEQRLRAALQPTEMELIDESAQHAGHAGAQGYAGGESHFRLTIHSAQFAGLGTLARHRLVYHALGDLMQLRVHALSIHARPPA
jgi:BolA family transcriptional regulator, general stress-responsive regulator